jgi:acetyltransferase-like isoleucine patch superfamily enzyme
MKRFRHPMGTANWFRAWARRIRSIPDLVRQYGIQFRLKRRGAVIKNACFIADHSGITGNGTLLSIGEGSFVGRVKIGLHAAVKIGSSVCINDDTELLTASHDVSSPTWDTVSAPIVIEDFAWIAKRCIILPGVTIGSGAVIGAGAVVAKDVGANTIVVGNPARPIQRSRCESLEYSPVEHVALFRAWKSA